MNETQPELTFRVVDRDNGHGFNVPVVISDVGVVRRASAEEAQLWEALQAVKAEVAALKAQKRGR